MSGGEPAVLLLMGPTGAGKTRLSLELAERFPIEIVSVDSAMVYRGLDIGTAKPTSAERARAAHHLIDIRDPGESYSAGQFVRDAVAAIDAIQGAGRIPLLVGGTMLYFHSLLRGLARLPEGDAGIRAQIDARARREGWPALHAQLARIDPQSAARIHPNDPQRIQRALEVYCACGVAMSALQGAHRPPLAEQRTLLLVADIADRAELHARIERRFAAMMQSGFLHEVKALHDRADLHAELPALRAVGYRQLWGHLQGEYTLEEGVQRAMAATRQLAKRQLTWLRALSRSEWRTHRIDARETSAAQHAANIVRTVAAPNFS